MYKRNLSEFLCWLEVNNSSNNIVKTLIDTISVLSPNTFMALYNYSMVIMKKKTQNTFFWWKKIFRVTTTYIHGLKFDLSDQFQSSAIIICFLTLKNWSEVQIYVRNEEVTYAITMWCAGPSNRIMKNSLNHVKKVK